MEELIKRCIEICGGEEFVFSDGDIGSNILLIGEAPGENEIIQKKPFVGKAGKNLDEFIQILGVKRGDVYITNSVKFRPYKISPKTGKRINRSPSILEIRSFRALVQDELALVDPSIIVTLGNTPLKQLLDEKSQIGDIHGKILKVNIGEKEYDLFPLYHPASVIYRRELKQVYIEDLQKLKKYICENGIV
ncbi:DNA polymerase [Peptoclostridium litorale DSM 5388]|uniref:Type-4 uracil-DNA glycosylase n=1 Tax=Peptoclostridium litorale DSM 5388 TaxID=1121324 RepID=A0A069RBT7_PEPLI|nr:uracil-DNA glycosylase [Peptoclostridium litorale]KDR94506.1 uracil-DNA glycosylase superfamily [Peptoclostridium litorale DSM 5388]SIO35406.1 DNA polymerase [Peptoclostridium litorale DSM 5388]